MNKTIGWSIVGAIVVIAALILGVPRLLNSSEPGTQATPTAQAIASRPDCPLRTVRGVELECLGGEKGDAEDVDKQKTLINVWAWWCEPCREELPMIQEFADTHPDWTVVLVHADASPAKGAAMLTDMGITLPSYSDTDGTFAGALSLPNVVPITLIGEDIHAGPLKELP